MSDSYQGPQWVVNSDEAAAGFMLFLFFISIPVIPVAWLGWYIGEDIIGNNFAKWGLMILFYGGFYLFLAEINRTKGFGYAFLVVFLEYLVWDIAFTVKRGGDELVMITVVKMVIEWGLSNT